MPDAAGAVAAPMQQPGADGDDRTEDHEAHPDPSPHCSQPFNLCRFVVSNPLSGLGCSGFCVDFISIAITGPSPVAGTVTLAVPTKSGICQPERNPLPGGSGL